MGLELIRKNIPTRLRGTMIEFHNSLLVQLFCRVIFLLKYSLHGLSSFSCEDGRNTCLQLQKESKIKFRKESWHRYN